MSLRFLTAGESHGKGCLAFVEGLPKGLTIEKDWIDRQLRRRQSGYGRSGRQNIEQDQVEVLSGVRGGRTIEAPLCLWVGNRDDSIERMPELTRPRPGHADFSGCLRHGDHDVRANLERASARETASRVAAGAVCQLLLRALGCEVLGHVVRIGDVASGLAAGAALHRVDLAVVRAHVEASEVGVLDAALVAPMKAAIDQAKADRDTLGGVVEVVSTGVPPGLGTFAQWDRRLDGRLAQALMSIQAFKAVEIGAGVAVGRLRGSQVHDAILPDGAAGVQRPTNRAGGLEGGVSNGEPLVLRATKKPIATLRRPLDSVDLASGEAAAAAFERSDVCAVPAASVIAEAMVAIVLAEASLDLFGGASLDDFVARGQAHAARAAAIRGGSESP